MKLTTECRIPYNRGDGLCLFCYHPINEHLPLDGQTTIEEQLALISPNG